MLTVKQLSELTNISVRTLHYYDSIGIFKPDVVNDVGYRFYSEDRVKTLQQILLLKELKMPLKDIKDIIDKGNMQNEIDKQIKLLTDQKQHLENIITFAKGIKNIGVENMDFNNFDSKKIDDYSVQAKALYGNTDAYKEFEQKKYSKDDMKDINQRFMDIFRQIGEIKDTVEPTSDIAIDMAKKVREFICENFYNCTPQILLGLSKMYCDGGSMNQNIDKAGGIGTGAFIAKAIEEYVSKM